MQLPRRCRPRWTAPRRGVVSDARTRRQVEGRLLDTTDLDALDRYEGVGRGLYVRVSVPLVTERSRPTSEEQRVAAYVGNPDELAVGESVSWPGPGPFAERVGRYVREASVCVRRA